MDTYSIQVRQKGAWADHIRVRGREAARAAWENFQVNRPAARLVEHMLAGPRVIATKKHRPHDRQR
jgi:hypothetical protein